MPDVAETQDLLRIRPRPKKFERLATRDTQHGSRPNLGQRDPNDRIVPTSTDDADKGASAKKNIYPKTEAKVKIIPST